MKKRIPWLWPALTLPVLLAGKVMSAPPPPSATQWLPPQAVAVLEITRPEALLNPLLSDAFAAAVEATPPYQKQVSTPGFEQFQEVVKLFETRLGTDWRKGVRKLAGGGILFGLTPNVGATLAVDAKDEAALKEFQGLVLDLAAGDAENRGQAGGPTSREYQGVTVWSLGGNAHTVIGNRLLLGSRPPAIRAALDLYAKSGGKSFASRPEAEAARKAALADDAIGWAFLDMKALRANPGLAKALEGSGNPLAELVLAGPRETLKHADWLAAGIHVEGDALELRLIAQGAGDASVDSPAQFAAIRGPSEGALPVPSVPRGIAGVSLHRDLHGFYAAKDKLFPERTSGLIFFENMMGIFFSGLDLTEQVLGETKPGIRVVVAEQDYDPAIGKPQTRLPAFAAILKLQRPEAFGEVIEEAWQKALGLINFTRGQKALPGLIIDRDEHLGTPYTVSSFRAPEKAGDDLHIRYNFRPTLARLGDSVILSSTDALAKDLIKALQKEAAAKTAALSKTHSVLEISGGRLASILQANRAQLVRQSIVEKGKTQEEAEAEQVVLTSIVETIKSARLSLATGDDEADATLLLRFELPAAAPDTRPGG